ncbi:predicted protein [Plenodomus lingam JN3]|uniref:Predicted protein n=1 Tax=Leptosphaeria maculans (strain JN3 / isolate v23.1.3 / race Av1-4-5-6-7-8) TaxID=985895 RepID=E5A072_LEPMJ|nr:predicted protein [Plenodomus lingam JN3]CBX96932.1 predicted protein [Plenodomus lingam JN3]
MDGKPRFQDSNSDLRLRQARSSKAHQGAATVRHPYLAKGLGAVCSTMEISSAAFLPVPTTTLIEGFAWVSFSADDTIARRNAATRALHRRTLLACLDWHLHSTSVNSAPCLFYATSCTSCLDGNSNVVRCLIDR